MTELYAELEDYILRDIVRRIMKAGRITATADRMIWLLRQMGEQQNEIQKKLAEMMGITQAELRRLLQGAVMTSWQDDLGTLSMITNTPVSSPLENPRVMSVMDAEYRKSLGELRNLTRTTMTAANSDLVRLLDEAEMRVASGAQSYSQAIIDVLDNYAGEGLKVTYPSGRRISLEAAVRMCVVTSMNQTAAQVTNQYIAEAGTNYVLVSAHIGARVRTEKQPPCAGHDEWQGKVYCIRGSEEGFPNLLESTGYDIDPVTGMGTVVNPLGLHGYNCRHGHRPFDKDLRNPYQNPDGSQKIDTKENERMFDLLQRQRAMERAIRRTKRELLVKQNETDLEPDADRKAALQRQADDIQARLWKQNRAYNDFCRKNGLATQYDRTHLAVKVTSNSLANDDKTGIIASGARITNLFSQEAKKFADMYYPEIRKMTTDVSRIAEHTGHTPDDIRKVKSYLFENNSLYDEEKGIWRRFDPDCAIAQSWQRLMIGKDIKPHDLTLINHELREMEIKSIYPDISHDIAHEMACESFDYQTEVDEYYGRLEKYKARKKDN